jgi:hypothetical protein
MGPPAANGYTFIQSVIPHEMIPKSLMQAGEPAKRCKQITPTDRIRAAAIIVENR